MWKILKKAFKPFQGPKFPDPVFTLKEDKTRLYVHRIVNDNFGVYISPSFDTDTASFTMKIMPDDVIDEIMEEYRYAFISSVNTLSTYMYEMFGIEELLKTFVGKPFNTLTAAELKDIIEHYIIMHESIMNKKMTVALAEAIIECIESKCTV